MKKVIAADRTGVGRKGRELGRMSRLHTLFLLLFLLTLPVWAQRDFIETAVWSPDGASLVAGHNSGSVVLHDALTGKKIRELRHFPKDQAVGYVAFLDATTFLSSTYEGHVNISKLDGTVVRDWNEGLMQGATLSPDGRRLAWHDLGKIRIREIGAGLLKPEMETDGIGMCFAPDGRTLAVGRGPNVVFFDSATGKRIGKLQKDGVFTIADMTFTPSGTLMMVDDISVREWSVPAGKPLRELVRGFNFEQALWLMLSPNAQSVAAGGRNDDGDFITFLWPTLERGLEPLSLSGRPLCVLDGGRVVTVVKAPTEVRLSVCQADGSISTSKTFPIPKDSLSQDLQRAALSPDGRTLALPVGNDLQMVSLP